MKKIFIFLNFLFFFSCSSKQGKEEFAPLFPFVISSDAPDNVTNMSHLLDPPAGKYGFVRVENEHFVTEAGPIRFNATNLTGSANFPSHNDADSLAARLARFGINCVRLHYFDAGYGNFREEAQTGIFGNEDSLPKAFSADPTITVPFDLNAVDRQDYLIAALKRHGIYVDINLHVARFPKGFSFISSRMIASEKEYAKRLLTRVNPYTGVAYTDEPSVAMIEINNENALLNNYHGGVIDNLPESYASEFCRRWNDWLKKKYNSTSVMRKVWDWKATPLCNEQIEEGHFDQTFMTDGKDWTFSLGSAKAITATENGVMKITVEQEGDQYFPKLFRNGVKMKKGEAYTISFKVRRVDGTGSVNLGAAVADAVGGWRSMGFHRTVKVGLEWTTVKATFAAADDTEKAQFQLTRFKAGVYELDDLSIQSGVESDFDETQSIEEGTIATLKVNAYAPPAVRSDFYQFLIDTESAYWTEIATYVKNELKAKAPISGTQLGYTSPFNLAKQDYVDIHYYWNHPSPVSPDWSIGNTSMVNSMSGIQELASQRVLGKPYTVSEYNHPFPNQFGAEGQPMLRAYGALQGWDGVFEYTWHHRQEFEPGWNSYFFSISERTDVLAHMPACAAIYLRGDVHEAKKTISGATDYKSYFERLVSTKSIGTGIGQAGFNRALTLIHKTGVDLSGKAGTDPASVDQNVAIGKILTSDTGELTWNREIEGAAYWTVNTNNTKLFTGFPEGRRIDLGGIKLDIGKTRLGSATISLFSKNATGFGELEEPANILLTATGEAINSGMELKDVGGNRITALNSEWGKAPVMVEGIPATIKLPFNAEKTKCFALDERGDRMKKVPVKKIDDKTCEITIGVEYNTIWYEIVVE